MGRHVLFFAAALVLGEAGCSQVLGIDGEYEDCICGDGVVCSIEMCDDGNTSDGDKCSSTCELREVVEVTAGNHHTCARLNDGSVKCWGRNNQGQLGLAELTLMLGDEPGEMGDKLPRVDLGEGRTAVKIDAGYEHTCAILDDGNVTCWGDDTYGALGLESGSKVVKLGSGKSAVAIGAGVNHTCAILNDGQVLCWGRNDDLQLGAGNPTLGEPPRLVDLGAGESAEAIAAGEAHTCALLKGKTVKCWGKNDVGQLGLGDKQDRPTPSGPVNLGADNTAKALVAGTNHTCAVLNDDSLLCWGSGLFGRLGLGDTMDQVSPSGPIDLGNGKVAKEVGASTHTCVMLHDGVVRCWGYNAYGQLGIGNPSQKNSPADEVKLGEGKTAVAIAVHNYHSCAILNDGSLKCWGGNSYGQLGLGDTSNRGDDSGEMGDALLPVKLFSDAW